MTVNQSASVDDILNDAEYSQDEASVERQMSGGYQDRNYNTVNHLAFEDGPAMLQSTSVDDILNDQEYNVDPAQPRLDGGRRVSTNEADELAFHAHDDSSYTQRGNVVQPTPDSEVGVYAKTNPSGTVPDRVLRLGAEGFSSVEFEGGTEHDLRNDLHTSGVVRGILDSRSLSHRLPISFTLEHESFDWDLDSSDDGIAV